MLQIPWERIKSHNDLPRNGQIFIAIWKGRLCIVQYSIEEQCFYTSFNPAQLPRFKIDQDKVDYFEFYTFAANFEGIEVDKDLSCEYCSDNEKNIKKCSLSLFPARCAHQSNDKQCSNYNFYNACKKDCRNYKNL